MFAMESKFSGFELRGNEVEWLRNLLADIPLPEKLACRYSDVPLPEKPTPSVALHCNSQAAITVANNHFNGRRNAFS